MYVIIDWRVKIMYNNYLVWAPLNKIDCSTFLYHYTTVEKAFKILYYKTLRFSNITKTNDIFEQKPKLSFDNSEKNVFDIIKEIQNYFLNQQKRIRILCFSQDYKERVDFTNLSKDQQRANVIGRGFALPRMWAQYSSNGEGVCFIINKEKLIKKILNDEIFCKHNEVQYVDSYSTYPMDKDYLIKLGKMIKSNSVDIFYELLKNNSEFVKFNFFTKLDDWESENEYRVLTIINDSNIDRIIEVNNIYEFVEGIVVGQNISEENCFILRELVDTKTLVRKIYFDSIITRIQDI